MKIVEPIDNEKPFSHIKSAEYEWDNALSNDFIAASEPYSSEQQQAHYLALRVSQMSKITGQD